MHNGPALLLVAAVAAVGVLHTMVPDHWLPIALIARQRGWSKADTAWAACRAGIGHVLSTLLIGAAAWLAGVAAAERFGHLLDFAASLALVGFGGWIALSSWAELRRPGAHRHDHPESDGGRHRHDSSPNRLHRPHSHAQYSPPRAVPSASTDDPLEMLPGGVALLVGHTHRHRHESGRQDGRNWVHAHWHDHAVATDHPVTTVVPVHDHAHKTTGRAALLLILGSSPMVEGIPAFFAAARYGAVLLGVLALVFAVGTIVTYVLLSVASSAGLQRVRFGVVERYGEVLSGGFIALVGVVLLVWQVP